MKTIIHSLFVLLFSGFVGNAVADTKPIPLPKIRLGNVLYSVSPSNRMIHLQMPFLTTIELIENKDLPDDSRYILNISGTWDPNLQRPEVIEIRHEFPFYRIADESQSVAVRDCQIVLGDGTKVECDSPPGTGAYFSSFTTLSREIGSKLRSDLLARRYPRIAVNVDYLEPWAESRSVTIREAEICRSLGGRNGVTIGSLIRGLAIQMRNWDQLPSKFLVPAADILMDRCLDPNQTKLSGSGPDLRELLRTSLRLKESIPEVDEIRLEEITWHPVRGTALTTIQAEVR